VSRVEKIAELTSIRDQSLAPHLARARLLELLADEDAEVRATAAGSVWSYPGAADLVRTALRMAKLDDAAEVRREATLALGRVILEGDLAGSDAPGYTPESDLGDPEAGLVSEIREHVLTTLEKGRTEDERLAAMEALGYLSARPEVGAAIEKAARGSVAARRAALRAMGRSGDAARWKDAILAGLEAKEPEVVLAAAWAAGEAGVREAAPRLVKLLSRAAAPGSDATITTRAAEALGRTGGPDAARALLEASESAPDEDLRQAAREALEELEVLAGIDDELGGTT
jgi:hypothetical protein